MLRRSLLATAALAAAGVAGCLQTNAGPGSGEGGPTVADSSIETVETDCADSEVGDVTIELVDGGLAVHGTVQAPTPCHDAVLVDVALDGDTLAIEIDVEEQEGICVQCVGEIRYEAVIEIDHLEAIEQVRVEHVGRDSHAVGLDVVTDGGAVDDSDASNDVDDR